MKFFNKQAEIAFMDKRKPAFVLSIILILVSITSVIVQGLNFGIDFTGGTLVEVSFDTSVDISDIRGVLEANQFDDALIIASQLGIHQHIQNDCCLFLRISVRENRLGGQRLEFFD